MFRKYLPLILALALCNKVFAFHIIGGEMIYKRLTGNDFEITLKIYRDCSNPEAAPFDDPLQIYVYNASGILVDSLVLFFPGSDNIDPEIVNPCMTVAPDLCVQEAIYVGNINLPPSIGGYDLVYQRCCRNSTIINIYDPIQTGTTYTEHIPDPGILINSSPEFNNLPPIALCAGYPFAFSHAATDPDGDALVYKFFTPYNGASYDLPDPAPASPPPFNHVIFVPPFNESYQIASSPAFTLGSTTGWLAGTPSDLGQFVVGVAVEEYRGGVLIGTHYRDFQFNVTDCTPDIVASAPPEINNCTDFTVLFDNESIGTDDFYWDFGVPGVTDDNSTEDNPVYTYPDTGTYTVMLIAFPGTDCSDTTFTTVHIYPQLIPGISFENTCAGSPVNFMDISTTDFGTITSWQWNYGDGWGSSEQNPVYSYEEPGNYMLIFTVENSVGCIAEIYDTITIYHLPFADVATDSACLHTSGTVFDASVVLAGNDIVDWQWEMEPDQYFSGESFDYYFDTAGVYLINLTVTTDKGCVDSILDTIIVNPQVVAGLLNDTVICEGDSVQVFASGGTYYAWEPPSGVSDPSSPEPWLSPDESTVYGVIVTDGCTSDTAFMQVEILPAPHVIAGPDTIVYHGQEVAMYANGASSFNWEPPDGLSDPLSPNPIALPDVTTLYLVTGTAENGCISTDTALVYIIPNCFNFATVNAFSPNDDGVNDRFRFITAGDDGLVSMEIYNRWGKMIFNTNDIDAGWDGTDGNGHPQELGSYIYVIYTSCDGKEQRLSGSVTLLR